MKSFELLSLFILLHFWKFSSTFRWKNKQTMVITIKYIIKIKKFLLMFSHITGCQGFNFNFLIWKLQQIFLKSLAKLIKFTIGKIKFPKYFVKKWQNLSKNHYLGGVSETSSSNGKSVIWERKDKYIMNLGWKIRRTSIWWCKWTLFFVWKKERNDKN